MMDDKTKTTGTAKAESESSSRGRSAGGAQTNNMQPPLAGGFFKRVGPDNPQPPLVPIDNFNKHAAIFAANPFGIDEPVAYTHPIDQAKHKQEREKFVVSPTGRVQLKEKQPIETKTKDENPKTHDKKKQQQDTRMKEKTLKQIRHVDKDNLPPPPTVPPSKVTLLPAELPPEINFDKAVERPDPDDDEPGQETDIMLSDRVLVAEHQSWFAQSMEYSLDIFPRLQAIAVIVRGLLDAIYKFMIPRNYFIQTPTRAGDLQLNCRPFSSSRRYKDIKEGLIFTILHSGLFLFMRWLYSNFYMRQRCYLEKTNVVEQDRIYTVRRHRIQTITERDPANFHEYEYRFYNVYGCKLNGTVNAILSPIRYVANKLGFNLPLIQAEYETRYQPDAIAFPTEFEKFTYVEFDMANRQNTMNTGTRLAMKEVVHSDLFQRAMMTSTFNMMNGVEALHSRISNVFNSSNDIVMYTKEMSSSAINGTKNYLSYEVRKRFMIDPNRNFHKGSPEHSSMAIEYSRSPFDGDPKTHLLQNWILGLRIGIGLGAGLQILSQLKSLSEYTSPTSPFPILILLTRLERLWEKLKEVMLEYLSSLPSRATWAGVQSLLH